MTMVVVGLIAAMAFQAAVNPPGGVWQDDTSSHRAGKAVMASTHPKLYNLFSRSNTIAFVSSLTVILLVAIGVPNKYFIFVVVVWGATVVSMASIAVSFGASLIMTDPNETISDGQIVNSVVLVFTCIIITVTVCILILAFHSRWKRQRQQHEDVTFANRIFSWFHHFYQFLKGEQ